MSAPASPSRATPGLARRALTWPLRRYRWLWLPWVYPLLCWLFMEVATPAPGVIAPLPEPVGRHRVWVLGYGYHTAIFLEQPRGWRLGPPGREAAPFVEFAWGDRGWFYDSDMSWLGGANAILLPSRSVYYVAGYDEPPARAWPGLPLLEREFNETELLALALVLERSVLRTPEGARVEALPPSPEYDGRFYPGRPYYIGWNSCNHWTIAALEQAGQEVSALGVVTQEQALSRLKQWRTVR